MNDQCCCSSSNTCCDMDIKLKKSWCWFLAAGIFFIILGIIAISLPLATAMTIELLLGWLFLIGGVVHGIHAFRAKGTAVFAIKILATILYLAAGILLLFYPLQGILTLTLLLAIFFIIGGLFKIVLALQFRKFSNWGWLLVSGLIALALGIMVWNQWPMSAAWVIGLLVGIDFLFGGWAFVMLSQALRKC